MCKTGTSESLRLRVELPYVRFFGKEFQSSEMYRGKNVIFDAEGCTGTHHLRVKHAFILVSGWISESYVTPTHVFLIF